jgi:mannonate dehydratase
MKVGLTLFGDLLSEDGARFAVQAGASAVVIHLTRYANRADPASYLAGGVGPILGDCSDETPWTFDDMAAVVAMLRRHGLAVAALENFSPAFWHAVLLDGPERARQMEGLKRLVRDAGRAGIPVLGYNFSLAGVWGWRRRPLARGGAMTVEFDEAAFDAAEPIPDGMVWNMRYRPGRPDVPPISVGDDELWQRLARFLEDLVPVAAEAGVTLAAHPDDPPADALRGTARLVNRAAKYGRLLGLVDSPANGLEFCLGSLQEMPGTDIYETTRHYVATGRVAYIHFRNVSGRVPRYHETFVDDGDIDLAEIVRILRDADYDGVLVPDHSPEMTCPSPWHAGNAYALGYMRALIGNADALGPQGTPRHYPQGRAAMA